MSAKLSNRAGTETPVKCDIGMQLLDWV